MLSIEEFPTSVVFFKAQSSWF